MSTLAPKRSLSVDDMVRACVISPIALASILKIDHAVRGPIPLDLWPDQIKALDLIMRYRRVSIDKARQLGISTGVLCLVGLWDCIAFPIGETGIFSLDQDEANIMKSRVKRLYESGPAWLHKAWPVAIDKADKFGLEHPEGVSSVECFAASGESGRSRTFRRVIADERARWKRKMGGLAAKQRMAAIRPAVGDVGSLVEVSTADGYDDHYETFVGAVEPGTPESHGNGYVRMFIGALARPDRTMEWVMREREILDRDEPGLGMQELPLTWEESFRASGRCAFDRDKLEELRAISCEPSQWRGHLLRDAVGVIPDENERGNWWVWEWPEPGRSYLISADACGGHGSDFAAAAVYDRETWEQVAAFHGKVEPAILANELVKAGWLYACDGRPALLAPEVNNHGQGVIVLLLEWNYPNLYWREVFDRKTKQQRRDPGWETNDKTRHQLVTGLQHAVGQGTLAARDAAFIAECHRFIWRETPTGGRWEADAGANDDRVITHGIATVVLSLSAQGQVSDARPIVQPVIAPGNRTGYLAG